MPKSHFLIRPLPIALLVLLGVGGMSEIHQQQKARIASDAQNQAALAQANSLRAQLELQLNTPLQQLRTLALLLGQNPDLKNNLNFSSLLQDMLRESPALRSINLTQGTTITHVAPKNAKIEGLDLRHLPKQWPDFARTMAEKRPRLTGPVQLVQGGQGLIYRVPILNPQQEYQGMVVAVLRPEVLLQTINTPSRWHQSLRNEDPANNTMLAGQDATFYNPNAQILAVRGPGYQWQLAVLPTPSHSFWREFYAERSWSLAVMLLMAVGSYALLRSRLARLQEQQLHSQQLQAALQRSQLALDAVNAGVWELDLQQQTLRWDEAMFRILGVDPTDFHGRLSDWQNTVHPDDLAMVEAHMGATLADPQQSQFGDSFRCVKQNGEVVYVQAYALIIRNEAGLACRMVGVNWDCTEKRLAEIQQRQYQRQLQQAQNLAQMGFWEYHPHSDRMQWSTQVYHIFGWDQDRPAPLVRDVLPQVHAADAPVLRQAIQATLRQGVPLEVDVRITHGQDGNWRHLRVIGQCLDNSMVNQEKRHVFGIVQDITRLKELDRLKNEFLATVSHELRTPLTAIMASLKLLPNLHPWPEQDPARNLLDVANRNADRLLLLINDLLDFEKITAGKMEFHLAQQELKPIVLAAIETTQPYAAKHGVQLSLLADHGQALALVDAARLHQVLVNLLSNAVKFTHTGPSHQLDGRVDVSLLPSASGGTRIAVADYGTGIPSSAYHRIFKKFSQVDSANNRSKGGTGLGLSIAQAMVEQMGGQIGFLSVEGVGTTFWVEFPNCAAPAP